MSARTEDIFDPGRLRGLWTRDEPEDVATLGGPPAPATTATPSPEPSPGGRGSTRAAPSPRPSPGGRGRSGAALEALAAFREAARADLGPRAMEPLDTLIDRAAAVLGRSPASSPEGAGPAATRAEVRAALDAVEDLLEALELP